MTSFKVLPPLLTALALANTCRANDDGSVANDLDTFNTLRDPTFLASQVSFGTDYFYRQDGAFRNRFVLSGDYAFGAQSSRDWVISAEMPLLLDDPGDGNGSRNSGLGDLKLGVGHVLDGIGQFRWGLGAAVTFDTASDDPFGDGALKISPQWGAGYRFRPDFELSAKVQYNASVWEDEGRSDVSSLEAKVALLKTWPGFWYSLVGYGSLWNFERDNLHSNVIKAEVGKAFGARQEWIAFVSGEAPVENRGANQFAVKLGLSYIFK